MSTTAAARGIPVGRLRKVLVFAMNAVAFFSLYASGELSPWSSWLFYAAMAGSWFWDEPRVNFARWQTPWTVVTLAAFGASLLDAVLSKEFELNSVIYFVVFLAGAKLFQLAENKDYIQSMALSLLLLAAGSALNDKLSFGAMFALYVLLSTVALTAQHLCIEVTEQQGNRGRSMPIERPVLIATLSLAVLVLAGSVMFFFAFPRVGFGFFVQQNRDGPSSSGFSEDVQLGGGGSIDINASVVMRIRFLNYRPNPLEEMYFRGISLDNYSGRSWTDEDNREAIVERDSAGRGYVVGRSGLTWEEAIDRTLIADVYLEPIDSSVLFSPGVFRAIGLPDDVTTFDDSLFGRSLVADKSGEVHLRQRSAQGTMYRVYSDNRRPNDDELAAARWPDGASSLSDHLLRVYREQTIEAGEVPVDGIAARDSAVVEAANRSGRQNGELGYTASHYLQLPDGQITARMQAMTARLRERHPTDHEFTVALEAELRGMGYTTDLPALSSPIGNVVDEFLFDWRRGSCTYFATAFVVLLRSQGIPARVVNGYLGFETNTVSDYHIVRQSNAHTWAEVYYPELGWVRFDPTPAQPGSLSAEGLRKRFNDLLDAARLQWFRWVVEYDLEKQVNVVRDAVEAVRSDDETAASLDIGGYLRDLLQWTIRHFAAVTVHVFVWLCATFFFRARATRRIPWSGLDWGVGAVWVVVALGVSYRFWPGGLTVGGVAFALLLSVGTTLVAWQLRALLFDEAGTPRRSAGDDAISAMYATLLRTVEYELTTLPTAITPDELVTLLDLRDPGLQAEVEAFVDVYVRCRFGGQTLTPEQVTAWRRRFRAVHRGVGANLRRQTAAG